MGFISDLLTNITAFRIKIGEKLIWLNNNKADKSELPSSTDYITTNTNQTGLSGNKETSGSWVFGFKNNTWYKDSLGNERLFFGTGSNANGMLFRLNDDAQRFQFRDKENAQIAAIASNGRITSLIDGNSSQWKQAYDWGDFRDYGLGRKSWGNSVDFSDVDVNTETRLRGVSGAHFGIISTFRPIGLLSKGVITERWSWLGTTDQGPIRVYATNFTNKDTYVELYHTGNLTQLKSDLNLDLSNYYTKPESVNLFVGVNNTQTIGGTKTFTNSPIVPDPTLDSHAANMRWTKRYFVTKDNTPSTPLQTTVIDFDDPVDGASILYAGASSTNAPSVATGTQGGMLIRGNHGSVGEYQLYIARQGDDSLLYRNQTGVWRRAASREWVNAQGFIKTVPDNYLTINNSLSSVPNGAGLNNAGAFDPNTIVGSVATYTSANAGTPFSSGFILTQFETSSGNTSLQLGNRGDILAYRGKQSGAFGGWLTVASREWVNGQGFVTTDTKYTAGTNVTINSSNVISATDTKYTAGNGLTLSGTQFSLPVTVSGTGTYVQKVEQNANGITVTLGTPPNTNTTYSSGTKTLIDAGTDTVDRVWNSKILKDAIIEHGGSAYTAGDNIQISATNVISATDTVYVHPTNAGNKHIPAGGSQGDYLKYNGDGTAMWARVTELDVESDTDYVALFEANL